MSRLILGHTTNDSIKLWVRGDARWPVAFVDVLDSTGRRTSPTKALKLDEEDFWTGIVEWDGLSPDRPYRAKVSFGKDVDSEGQERIRDAYTEGNFRTFPVPDLHQDFSFLLGSCNLHSLGVIKNPDKSWARIAEVSKVKEARFMIHCGDQIYADIPLSPPPDPDHYRRKYLDAWDDCRTARAYLTQTSHYMILDDHEITNNFDQDMEAGGSDHMALRNAAMKVYWEFQHKHNPNTEQPSQPRRYYYQFTFGAAEFFVLDTRFRRSSQQGEMIDCLQIEELKSWLSDNSSKLKFVVSSVPFVGQVRKPRSDKWCSDCFYGQRSEIFEFLHKHQIQKTVFLTGDMHTSYHAAAKLGDGDNAVTVHELMSSPINQFTPNTALDECYVPTHSFATKNGVSVVSRITPKSFYGSHSSVMAITVADDRIRYQIFRTRKAGKAQVSGSFGI